MIDIKVQTTYIAQQSNSEDSQFVFRYTITITNRGKLGAKLLTRHWIITDAHGNTNEVKGEGVVGEQPHLTPTATYEYSSGTVLPTPVGCMCGSYQFVDDNGTLFSVEIPMFTLAVPNILH